MNYTISLIVLVTLLFSDLPFNIFTVFLALILILMLSFLNDILDFIMFDPLKNLIGKFKN